MELKNVIKTAMVAFALGVASPVGAADYYVTTNGNDANAGTSLSAPFKTIYKGMSNLQPRDVLYIRGGEYSEAFPGNIPFNNSSATSWDMAIRISAYQGEVVVIKPLSGDQVFRFSHAKHSYIILDGLIIDGENVSYDTVKITNSTSGGASHHIWIKNSTIKNGATQGVLTSPGSNHNIFTNVIVTNNGWRGTRVEKDFHHGLYLASDGNIVEKSRIFANAGWGVHVYSETSVISNNIVRANLVYDNAAWGVRGPGIGLYSGPGHRAYGNIIWGNNIGIALHYGAKDALVHDNIVYLNKGPKGNGVPISDNGVNTTLFNNTLVPLDIPSPIPSIPGDGDSVDNSNGGDSSDDPQAPPPAAGFLPFANALTPTKANDLSIRYRLSANSSCEATFEIYNQQGQLVKHIAGGAGSSSECEVRWSGANEGGRPVASGAYTVILTQDGQTYKKKMVVVK